ncbi:uncharacterized protein LOC122661814 [Telopea speciosissima]|uniref:uncharacterized protein LOC122661814 n=1 Tax=Telopea speciosissima TaxID=54955 RepID=UPI001CC53FF7|nr:uncharacterized protein LOC122661814 [Telopea speciosissima]
MMIDKEMKMDKDEICHPSHPQHKLKLHNTQVPFICDGCKEAGIGLKYECEQCDFELHKTCAVAPPVTTHPFKDCEFKLYERPPGTGGARVCDACRNEVEGFVYHCKRCGFDLHPCCANLPQVLLVLDNDGEHNNNLYLCSKLSRTCDSCGGKKGRGGWSYRTECKNYNYHVSCVKKMFMESWEANKSSTHEDNIGENKKQVMMDLQLRIPKVLKAPAACIVGIIRGGKLGRF